MKKFMNYIGEGVDATGFCIRFAVSKPLPDFFRICREVS